MLEHILKERGKTHGNFVGLSKISQEFKQVIFNSGWQSTNAQHEAIDMIVHKLARILNGNSNEKDHWLDIQGYCQLVINELDEIPY